MGPYSSRLQMQQRPGSRGFIKTWPQILLLSLTDHDTFSFPWRIPTQAMYCIYVVFHCLRHFYLMTIWNEMEYGAYSLIKGFGTLIKGNRLIGNSASLTVIREMLIWKSNIAPCWWGDLQQVHLATRSWACSVTLPAELGETEPCGCPEPGHQRAASLPGLSLNGCVYDLFFFFYLVVYLDNR